MTGRLQRYEFILQMDARGLVAARPRHFRHRSRCTPDYVYFVHRPRYGSPAYSVPLKLGPFDFVHDENPQPSAAAPLQNNSECPADVGVDSAT
ncbi:hypothetical protein EVAR_47018_1 [Eumeta japonica]|uniref:Uncharacterized protein n=1 Tax=Eumeta variegata TaxID=151549 RepID=A0A4C1XF69_EUMVA|nr:hypothetical protein EVAR_47018_1 [Eumeta japonica]